jgi:hypothetical protein
MIHHTTIFFDSCPAGGLMDGQRDVAYGCFRRPASAACRRTSALIATPDRVRSVTGPTELARDHQLREFGMGRPRQAASPSRSVARTPGSSRKSPGRPRPALGSDQVGLPCRILPRGEEAGPGRRQAHRGGRPFRAKTYVKGRFLGVLLPICARSSYFRSGAGMNCLFIAYNHGVQ